MKRLLIPIIAAAITLPALAADKDKIEEPSAKEASGTYLGVAMGEIPPLTRAQLGLPEGIGVSVEHVTKGSAAEKAGLKVNDIITQLDEQLIINSQQLQTLIRTKKPGEEVKLTYIRKGKEHKVKAKLSNEPIVARTPKALRLQNDKLLPFNLPNGLGHGQMQMFKLNQQNLDQLNEQLKNIPGINPEELKKLLEGQGLNFGQGAPKRNGGKEFKFHFNLPDGNNEDPNLNIRRQVMSSVSISDNTGSYTLNTKNGKKTFTAKDPDGAESFTGPVDTEEQRDSLDRNLIKKLEQLEGMGAGKGGIQLNGLNLKGGNFKFDRKFDFNIEPFKRQPKNAPKKERSDA